MRTVTTAGSLTENATTALKCKRFNDMVPHAISDCCGAPIEEEFAPGAISSEINETYYICDQCGNPCDFIPEEGFIEKE